MTNDLRFLIAPGWQVAVATGSRRLRTESAWRRGGIACGRNMLYHRPADQPNWLDDRASLGTLLRWRRSREKQLLDGCLAASNSGRRCARPAHAEAHLGQPGVATGHARRRPEPLPICRPLRCNKDRRWQGRNNNNNDHDDDRTQQCSPIGQDSRARDLQSESSQAKQVVAGDPRRPANGRPPIALAPAALRASIRALGLAGVSI
jgi:hypothetical protein